MVVGSTPTGGFTHLLIRPAPVAARLSAPSASFARYTAIVRARIILNPKAGTADQREWIRMLQQLCEVELCQTAQKGDAARMAREAPDRGFDTVVAAGGDGTIHEVASGLVHLPPEAICLAVVPLGTGNDMARTLAIPADPLEAVGLIEQGTERRIDVMKVQTAGQTYYGINVAAGGFTGQMNEAMTDDLKETWGPLAYLRGALKVLPDLTAYQTLVRWDDEREPVQIDAYNIIVANGRTAGGGTVVAPVANPEDGLLDVVVVHSGSVADLTGVAARLLAGDYTTSDVVAHHRVRRIAIAARPGMWFNLDGELLSNEPVEIEVLPRRLRVLVGEDYQAAPEA